MEQLEERVRKLKEKREELRKKRETGFTAGPASEVKGRPDGEQGGGDSESDDDDDGWDDWRLR
jgi:hypothetical protein